MEILVIILAVAAAALYLIRRYARTARLLKSDPAGERDAGGACASCRESCPHAGNGPGEDEG